MKPMLVLLPNLHRFCMIFDGSISDAIAPLKIAETEPMVDLRGGDAGMKALHRCRRTSGSQVGALPHVCHGIYGRWTFKIQIAGSPGEKEKRPC
jgi:hypothetical protein